MAAIHIIIVNHNSEQVLSECLRRIACQQRKPDSCIVVDSGSLHAEMLPRLAATVELPNITLLYQENLGFGAANNRGFAQLLEGGYQPTDIVLFLNPDAFLSADCLQKLSELLPCSAGAITGTLMGYDFEKATPTGKVDSTGIFRKWYGRWYDRDQGQQECRREDYEEIPAICGAFMACRMEALLELWQEAGAIFDERFFLYKEDIELSLNLRRHGWRLFYVPRLRAWHCRGWERQKMSYKFRLMAAENECRLYLKYPSLYLFWAGVKYLLVRFFRI